MLQDRRVLPGRPERRVGLQEPAVRVGRVDDAAAASTARRTRTKTLLPRHPHLRHLEHRRRRCRSAACRPAAARTRTRWCVRRTTRTTSTSTSRARPASRAGAELAGCDGNNTNDPTGENPSKWRIDVIKVPLAAPQDAAIVSAPRLFADAAGARQRPAERAADAAAPVRDAPTPPCGPGTNASTGGQTWSPTPITDACHDITVYEALDLAAGACEGNGLLIDISDPANPKRIDAVADPLFAYWHGATFSNDGKAVVFTDEWGGGTGARCRATDQLSWGANAIYEIVNRKLVFRATTSCRSRRRTTENCVSHVGNLIPVPNRNVLVQAWYQGGVSVVDFTDLAQPEGDRVLRPRPGQTAQHVADLGGFWSTYWYNGRDLRLGDRARLRLVHADADGRPLGGRDRRGRARPRRAHQRRRARIRSSGRRRRSTAPVGGNVPATLSLTIAAPGAVRRVHAGRGADV